MTGQALFSEEQRRLLQRIAGGIIPPSTEHGLPGADDQEVLPRLYGNPESSLEKLQQALVELAAEQGGAAALAALDRESFEAWLAEWADAWPRHSHPFFRQFIPMLLRAYYHDPRVLQAYDRRPGPPFPQGYAIIDGDWSLLESVRSRSPLFR